MLLGARRTALNAASDVSSESTSREIDERMSSAAELVVEGRVAAPKSASAANATTPAPEMRPGRRSDSVFAKRRSGVSCYFQVISTESRIVAATAGAVACYEVTRQRMPRSAEPEVGIEPTT